VQGKSGLTTRYKAEGLANDTGTITARGLRQGYRGGVGGSSADGEPGAPARRCAAAATSAGKRMYAELALENEAIKGLLKKL